MSMKIDGYQQSAETDRTRRGESTPGSTRSNKSGTARTTSGTDRVDTWADVQLAAAAMKAVMEAPSVRPEAVERARQALHNGTLGADANRLADSIITTLLDQ